MKADLKGKIALITGASRGIGKSISLALGKAGAIVILTARNKEKLNEVKKIIESNSGKALVLAADLSKEEEILALFKKIKKEFNQLDILINNAAVGVFKDLVDLSSEDFDYTFNVNVKSIFTICKQALNIMIPKKSGYIINISSIQGIKAYKQQSVYAASKHAVMGLTKGIAAEVQHYGIKVSAILPGGVNTEFIREARPNLDSSTLVKSEDIANTVLYLLSLSDKAMVDQIVVRRYASTPF